MKLGGKSRQARAIIIELRLWRERTAQDENVPRGRMLKDEAIYEIAKHAPRSLDALSRLRSVREVLNPGATPSFAASQRLWRKIRPMSRERSPTPNCPASASAAVELLRVLLKAVSAELNVAPKLLASAEDLEKLAQYDEPDIPALRGWRRQFFGEKALALAVRHARARDQEQGSAEFPL